MNYLLIYALISILVFLHELGHLLAANWCGIPIAQFSVGFGWKLWSVQVGDTEYCVSAFRFGGYVLPMLNDEEFQQLSLQRQVMFALGGPLANLLAAVTSL